jgi:hypothetical protein
MIYNKRAKSCYRQRIRARRESIAKSMKYYGLSKMRKSRDVRKCGEETNSGFLIFSREDYIKRRLFLFNIETKKSEFHINFKLAKKALVK